MNITPCKATLDIEVYTEIVTDKSWHQAKYLVHGYDDVYWTNSIDSALNYLKNDICRIEKLINEIREKHETSITT